MLWSTVSICAHVLTSVRFPQATVPKQQRKATVKLTQADLIAEALETEETNRAALLAFYAAEEDRREAERIAGMRYEIIGPKLTFLSRVQDRVDKGKGKEGEQVEKGRRRMIEVLGETGQKGWKGGVGENQDAAAAGTDNAHPTMNGVSSSSSLAGILNPLDPNLSPSAPPEPKEYARNWLIFDNFEGGRAEELEAIFGDHVDWSKPAPLPVRGTSALPSPCQNLAEVHLPDSKDLSQSATSVPSPAFPLGTAIRKRSRPMRRWPLTTRSEPWSTRKLSFGPSRSEPTPPLPTLVSCATSRRVGLDDHSQRTLCLATLRLDRPRRLTERARLATLPRRSRFRGHPGNDNRRRTRTRTRSSTLTLAAAVAASAGARPSVKGRAICLLRLRLPPCILYRSLLPRPLRRLCILYRSLLRCHPYLKLKRSPSRHRRLRRRRMASNRRLLRSLTARTMSTESQLDRRRPSRRRSRCIRRSSSSCRRRRCRPLRSWELRPHRKRVPSNWARVGPALSAAASEGHRCRVSRQALSLLRRRR
jgi:hypothetical protein